MVWDNEASKKGQLMSGRTDPPKHTAEHEAGQSSTAQEVIQFQK
jgi:hypothetical protein